MNGLPLLEAAVRPPGRTRSEPRHDQVARAVRRHAVAAPPSGAGRRHAAGGARRGRRPGVLATAGGLVFAGGGDVAFHAVDAASGARVVARRRCRGARTRTPMTYRSASGRQFVVIATGGGEDAALVAFAVPQQVLSLQAA